MSVQRWWWLPGVFTIAFGVLIAVFPELLAMLVAAAFVSAGVGMLVWGSAFRRVRSGGGVTRIYRTQPMNRIYTWHD